MTIYLKKAAVIVTQCVLFGAASLAWGQECCRNLDSPPRYTEAAIHPDPVWDSTIISLDSTGVVLRVRKSVTDPYFRVGEFEYLEQHDNGETWVGTVGDRYSQIMSPTVDLVAAPSDGKILYRKASIFGLYLRSDDAGRTWSLPSYNIGSTTKEAFVYAASRDHRYFLSSQIVAVDPRRPLTIYANLAAIPWGALFGSIALPIRALKSLYVSHDGGNDWVQFGTALISKCPLAISPSDPKVMVGCEKGGLVRSTDGGVSWRPIAAQQRLEEPPVVRGPGHTSQAWPGWNGLDIRQISFDPADERVIYLVTNKGIYRSTDGTDTWCLLNLGFDEIEVINNLTTNEAKPSEIVVGTRYGAFLSMDRGCHFRKIYPVKKTK
jgi:photosystem II stability/assembly factor-like uncharacterized protein